MRHVKIGYELGDFIRAIEKKFLVHRSDLTFGDTVLVRTLNSLYVLHVWGDDIYGVTGGWFDRNGYSIAKLKINGCTWGGSAIKQDVIAGKGLCIEFNNGVRTSLVVDILIRKPLSLN